MIFKSTLIGLSILLLIPNFINKDINEILAYNHIEKYNPALGSLNSIDKLEMYVDKEASVKKIEVGSFEYLMLLSYVISYRFYHGYSHYKLNENWIAAITEKITGVGVSCKVQPNAMMKDPYAACSQQALIMMDVLRRKKLDYRNVGFPHHYALEVKSNGNWFYFDPNMEPSMNLNQRLHENWKENNDSLKKYYVANKNVNLSFVFGTGVKANFGPINERPAQRVRLFQIVTAFFSKILWCFPLLFLFVWKGSTKLLPIKTSTEQGYSTKHNPVFSS